MNGDNSTALPGRQTCLVCGSAALAPFFHLDQAPVHCNRLWADPASARQAPLGELRLAFCRTCGHIFNLAFDPALLVYDEGYENSLHFSERFNQYAHSTAARLVQQYGLRGKDIVEIGSGKGEFLSMLCELGGNRGVGFDPSYDPAQLPGPAQPGSQVQFVSDFYSDRYASLPADLVCARHVLEHVPEPRDLLASVRGSVGDNPERVVFFEVPNVLYTLRDLGIWDIIYEHVSYFSPGSLAWLFRTSGFEVIQVQEAFGGQFLTIEARPTSEVSASQNPAGDLQPGAQTIARLAENFAENDRQKWAEWGDILASLQREGRRAAAWGAGSKGVTFLNRFRDRNPVRWVVDINPRKQGKYIPGTGQEVVPPEWLPEIRPDVILVMNPLYEAEIKEVVSAYGLEPEYLQV